MKFDVKMADIGNDANVALALSAFSDSLVDCLSLFLSFFPARIVSGGIISFGSRTNWWF